jgi:hypothetical protein
MASKPNGRNLENLMTPAKSLLLVTLLMIATATQAAPVTIVGLDDMSCRDWIRGKEDKELHKAHLAWVRGVLTGHNYANQKQQVSNISHGTVENFVNRYCSDNPDADFSDAALRMSDKFSGRNEALLK